MTPIQMPTRDSGRLQTSRWKPYRPLSSRGSRTHWIHPCALPNREPFRAYSNFQEFVADDGEHQTKLICWSFQYSIFLVEIKSRPGEVGGDSHT